MFTIVSMGNSLLYYYCISYYEQVSTYSCPPLYVGLRKATYPVLASSKNEVCEVTYISTLCIVLFLICLTFHQNHILSHSKP